MRLPTEAPQCGVCSQCVDRRFAVLVAGLGDADPVRGYTTDLFLDDLYGATRTMAVSYVRFARENKDRGADALVDAYPQLAGAVPSNDPQPAATMRMLCGLVQRQCQSVWSVAERQVAAARAGRTAKPPGADSLVGLLLRQQGVPLLAQDLPGLRLSPEEQRDADRYGFKATEPIVLTGITTKRASNVVQIGQRSAEVPDAEFRLLLRLVVALFETKDGYAERGRMMRGGGLITEGIYREESMEQVTSALRTRIKPAFVGVDGTEIIEVSRGRIRLSMHSRLVCARRRLLLEHPDALIRAWAERLPESAEDRAPA